MLARLEVRDYVLAPIGGQTGEKKLLKPLMVVKHHLLGYTLGAGVEAWTCVIRLLCVGVGGRLDAELSTL